MPDYAAAIILFKQLNTGKNGVGVKKMIDLTVSIVNTNNKDLLEKCLSSLFSNTHKVKIEVFVVDNASDDGSKEMIKAKFSRVKIISNIQRKGYFACHNQVIKKSHAKFIILLNEDIIIMPNALDNMVEFMRNNSEIGAIGCKILNPDGSLQHSCFRFTSLWQVFCDYYLKWVKNPKLQARYHTDLYNTVFEPDWVQGSCIMLRKEALQEVGGLDDSFFIFWEDMDICYRLKKHNWKVFYIPNAKIIHFYGQSRNNDILLASYKSRYLFFKKHFGKTRLILLICLVTISEFIRFLKKSISRDKRLAKFLLQAIKISFMPHQWQELV
jgi:hypothetical protein